MRWSDIPFNPSPRTLRQFAGLWVLFFGLASWRCLARGDGGLGTVLAVLAASVGLLGLVRPRAVRPVFVGWMVLVFPLGWVVARVVLACLFYGVFTPVGLLFRLIGRDALLRTRRPDRASYWLPKPAATDPRQYFRPF